jgi:oligoribonuclease
MNTASHIVWLDLETTGFDETEHYILEVGVILTDVHGNEVSRYQRVLGFDPVKQAITLCDAVHDMHTNNGLLAECAALERRHDEEDRLDEALSDWLSGFGVERPWLGGFGIHFDRTWLKNDCAGFEALLHYRNMNASSLAMAWLAIGVEPSHFTKERPHRAMADAEAALEMYRWQLAQLRARNL